MFGSSFQGLKSGNLGRRLLATLVWSAKLVEPYKNDIARRTEIETKVHIHVRLHGYEARGAVHGEILYVIFCIQWMLAWFLNCLRAI